VPLFATSEPYDLKEVVDRVIDIEQTIVHTDYAARGVTLSH